MRRFHYFAIAAILLVSIGGQLGRWIPQADCLNVAAPWLVLSALVLTPFALWKARASLVLLGLVIAFSGERILPEIALPEIAPPEIASARAAPAASGQQLSVLTFNAWHALDRTDLAAKRIVHSHADIVLLQEAGHLMHSQRERLATAYPYQSQCLNQRCELAILSRFPMGPVSYRFHDGAGRAYGPELIHARITLPDGSQVRAASIHVPRPTSMPDGGAALYRDLAETVARNAEPGLILGGDFNLPPWSFALQRLDSAVHPVERVTRADFSYPAQVLGVTVPSLLPIDQIYAGPGWRVHSSQSLAAAGSDHRPVLASLVPGAREPIQPPRDGGDGS